LTNLFDGRLARGIINWAIQALGPLSPMATAFTFDTATMTWMREGAEAQGRGVFTLLWACQSSDDFASSSASEITRS